MMNTLLRSVQAAHRNESLIVVVSRRTNFFYYQ